MTYLRQSITAKILICAAAVLVALMIVVLAVPHVFAGDESEPARAPGKAARLGDKSQRFEGFQARIQAAVESGKLTQEQADERLTQLKERYSKGSGSKKGMRAHGQGLVQARIQAAVESGKLTQEQADQKLAQGKEKFGKAFASAKGMRIRGLGDIQERIQTALESGKITQEQAESALSRLSKRADS